MLVLDGEHLASALAFTPDGTQLVAGRRGGPVDVWTLASGERVRLPGPEEGFISAPVPHPSGRSVLVAGRQLFAINLADQSLSTVNTEGRVDNVICSPDGTWVVVGPSFTFYVIFGYRCSASGLLTRLAWSADPRVFHETPLGFVSNDLFVTQDRNLLVVRDAATGEVRTTVKYPPNHYHSSAVSPDGSRLAVMGYDKLYIWDTATWSKPTRIPKVEPPIVAMAFHPTRPILATVQNLQTLVKFLDVGTGKPVAKFNWKQGLMESVCFSPDGTLAAAGTASGKIVVWDVD